MLRAILFDLSGVLLDEEPLRLSIVQALAAEQGLTLHAETFWARYAGLDDRAAIAGAFRDLGRSLPLDELRRLAAERSRRFQAAIAGRVPLFPGAAALVREAAKRAPIAIAGSAPRDEVALVLKQAGLHDRLTALLGGDEAAPPPSPDRWHKLLEGVNRDQRRMGQRDVTPREVLVLEDTEAGVAAAREAGMRCVAVGHTQPHARLAAADAFVARLLDLDLDALERELF